MRSPRADVRGQLPRRQPTRSPDDDCVPPLRSAATDLQPLRLTGPVGDSKAEAPFSRADSAFSRTAINFILI